MLRVPYYPYRYLCSVFSSPISWLSPTPWPPFALPVTTRHSAGTNASDASRVLGLTYLSNNLRHGMGQLLERWEGGEKGEGESRARPQISAHPNIREI